MVQNIKPRPNDRNILTQHIATYGSIIGYYFMESGCMRFYQLLWLLSMIGKKKSLNSTCRNVIGRIMLRTFGHPIATCWFKFENGQI